MESRELIMRRLLSKEKVDEGLDFKELATMTEGYSGSDLKVSDSITRHECIPSTYIPMKMEEKASIVHAHCSVTESMHHGSISSCEGADTEGKKEGAGNVITTHLKLFTHEQLCEFTM
jgi:hypothetical protein